MKSKEDIQEMIIMLREREPICAEEADYIFGWIIALEWALEYDLKAIYIPIKKEEKCE